MRIEVLASHTELIPDSENESGEKIQRLVIRSITAIQRKYEFYKPSEALLLTDDALLSVELQKKLVEDFGIESEVKDYRTDLQFQFGKRLADDPGKVSAEVAILTGALLGQDQPPQGESIFLKPKKAKIGGLSLACLQLWQLHCFSFFWVRVISIFEISSRM